MGGADKLQIVKEPSQVESLSPFLKVRCGMGNGHSKKITRKHTCVWHFLSKNHLNTTEVLIVVYDRPAP